MRRWLSLDRSTRAATPRAWDRCVLTCEQLEARENPAPLVFSPNFEGTPETPEGNALSFASSESFSLLNSAAMDNVHRATLTAASGTITVGTQAGVTVSGNGTSTVVLTGLIGDINSLIVAGFSYTPTGFYSGEETVRLNVTDLGIDAQGSPTTATGTADGSFLLRVTPVASPAALSVNTSSELWGLSSGFVIPPGTFTVSSWPDADGSETATVLLSLDAPNAGSFRLFVGPNELSPVEPGLWRLTANSQAELQAALDSLTLVPPSGFNDRAALAVFGSLVDQASYPSSESTDTTNPQDLGSGVLNLRFFLGTDVTLPGPLTAPEGGTVDLGGRFVGTDPDLQSGDTSVFTIVAPVGLLTFRDSALVAGMSADRTVTADGSTIITLTGDLTAINAFLATPGSVMYSAPDPDFSGTVPLAVTLANRPSAPNSGGGTFAPAVTDPQSNEAPGKFVGFAPVSFMPEADDMFPIADDATTTQDTPVAVFLGLASPDTDPSEGVILLVEGLPDGASLNNGTDLGDGMWALALTDLVGLVYTPTPGTTGVFAFTVTALVTDGDPETGMSDSTSQSTTFTITVLPAPAPTPDDDPDIDPTINTTVFFDDDFEDEAEGDIEDSTGGGDEVGEVSADPDGDTEEPTEEVEGDAMVLPTAFAGGSPDMGTSTSEGRVGVAAPGSGSLFAQPESPQLAYGGEEKHPLPPVLPLDQSSPAAGFTESGGDSFALIDKLLRGDAMAQVVEPAATGAAATTQADLPKPDQVTAAAAPESATAVPPSEEAAANEWRYWVAGTALAGASVAWAWLSFGRDGRLARAFRRLLYPARRPVPNKV